MGKRPEDLDCPTCESKNVYFSKRNKVYTCRRCGTEFSVTATSKGLHKKVFDNPLDIAHTYKAKTSPKKPAPKKSTKTKPEVK